MIIAKSNLHLIKCLIFTITFLLGSCGYVSDKPPVNLDVFKSDKLQACKIDIDKLGEIFKENQEEQIRCLKENFIQFTKYVKTSNSDSVNQSEIGDFVKKIFQGQSDSVVKGLSIIFQMNMILLRDEARKISKGNITPLFELLVTANREAIIITQAIQDMGKPENQEKFFEIRLKLQNSLNRFSNTTLNIMKMQTGSDQSLNIREFVTEAAKKLGNKEIDKDTLDSLTSFKQILVSGNREIITSKELEQLIQKLPNLLLLTFDVYYSTSINFKGPIEQARYYLEEIRGLNTLINFDQTDFQLITIDQLIKMSKSLSFTAELDLGKFKSSIIVLKKRLIGGNPETISLIDIRKTLDLVLDLNERIYFDNVTYQIRSELLNTKKGKISIQDLSPINVSDYNILSTKRVQELTRNFNQVIVDFKYFSESSELTPYYGTNYKRTRYGVLETSSTRWIANKIIQSYGHLVKSEYQVSLQEFQTFLFDMKPLLEEFKLWSPNPDTFARNVILLGDLFQNQSNGDLVINEREATEYITMILAASNLSDKYSKSLSAFCDAGINTEDPLFNVKCFNDNFYDLFLNKLKLKASFPRLYEYVNSSTPLEAQNYLKGIEGFARDINDPNVPINKRDSILILGSMVNVETTFIRFDTNLDNVIDYSELMEAFKIYKNAIMTLAELKPGQESFAPSIFLYMVAKMEVPPNNDWIDNIKFYSFHKCVQYEFCRNTALDPIVAKRLNIGALLYYLVTPVATTKKPK